MRDLPPPVADRTDRIAAALEASAQRPPSPRRARRRARTAGGLLAAAVVAGAVATAVGWRDAPPQLATSSSGAPR